MLWIHTAPLQKEGADALIILGFQCDGDRIHPLLEERLLTALGLMQAFDFRKIILTGGAVTSVRTEADIMKDYLVQNGVAAEKILLDREAADTIENLENCRAIMERYQLKTSLLISNSFHIRRIQAIARAVGFHSSYYADRSFRAVSRQLYRTMHELKTFVITYKIIHKRNESGKRS
jgi:uncharacterized SAM-binding protein YcdF (DUF218 family)